MTKAPFINKFRYKYERGTRARNTNSEDVICERIPKRNGLVRTADVIATYNGKLVLIKRLRNPFGLAFPGGHVDPGETPLQAGVREFSEETGLILHDAKFLMRRGGKRRDPRYAMSNTRVYVGVATGTIRNEKGFTEVILMDPKKARGLSREQFAFDHGAILEEYFKRGA